MIPSLSIVQSKTMSGLEKILSDLAQNSRNLCVFDLDSTLFNVSPRTQRILHEFADLYHQDLKSVEIEASDWGLKEPLIRHGYSLEQHSQIHQGLRDFWVERFFSNNYIHYDVPYAGAISFVQKLSLDSKNNIYYLTGRDVHRMEKGTYEVLKKWGFPISENSVQLKPHRSMEDHLFKRDWILDLQNKNPDSTIYLFENEPVNINFIGKTLKNIEIVFLDTTHSRKEQVNVQVIKISDFRRSI